MKALPLVISTIMFLPSNIFNLVNPFACKRPQQEPIMVVKKILGVVDLVGIVGVCGDWQAILKYCDCIYTLRRGECIGDVVVREVSQIRVCVLYKNKELVLTVKDE
jgi:hypothetical protein